MQYSKVFGMHYQLIKIEVFCVFSVQSDFVFLALKLAYVQSAVSEL